MIIFPEISFGLPFNFQNETNSLRKKELTPNSLSQNFSQDKFLKSQMAIIINSWICQLNNYHIQEIQFYELRVKFDEFEEISKEITGLILGVSKLTLNQI